jgi:hypothetical protein
MGKTEVRLIRRPDWEARLISFVESRSAAQFRWGEHDCCLFACDAIEAITGVDPAKWFRGRYSDRHGAVVSLRRFCDGGLEEAMARIAHDLNAPEIAPAYARRGDAVFLRQANGIPSFGICMGAEVAVAALPAGVAMLPGSLTLRAWRVG